MAIVEPKGSTLRRFRVRRRITFSIVALLVTACAVAGLATLSAANQERWASHTLTVRQKAATLLGAVVSAEAAERNFLLTGQSVYRTDYQAARAQIPDLERQLSRLTADNPVQRARMAALGQALDTRMAWLDHTQALALGGDPREAIVRVRAGAGRRQTQLILAQIDGFAAAEQQLYEARSAAAANQRVGSLVAILFSIVAAVLLAVVGANDARRYRLELEAKNAALAHEIAER